MKKIQMNDRTILVSLLSLLLSSCLKENAIPISSSFSIEVAEDKTAPVIIKLQNDSYGADEYEWIFEGGSPSSSREKQPGAVTFTEAGEHKIRLRVKHAVEKKVSEQPIRVDSTLFFFVEPHHSKYQITPFLHFLMNHNCS